jgi:tetratricopeptide (TPR) repeat protein
MVACTATNKTQTSSNSQEESKAANTLFFSGIQFKNQEKWDQSIEAFESYIKMNPSDATAYYEIARMLRERKLAAPEALENAKKAFSIDPKNKWYALELGRCYAVNNQLNEATAFYESAHDLDKKWTLPLFEMADAYLSLNKTQKAIDAYNRVEKINGKEEYLTQSKFQIYVQAHQEELAAKELESLALAYPKEITYTFQAADYYMQIQKSDQALVLLKKNKLENSGYYQYLLFQERCAADPGNIANFRHLELAMESSQVDVDKRVIALYPYLYQVNEPAVQVIIEKCINSTTQLFPEDAKAFSMKGDFLATQHKDVEAVAAYKETLRLDPSKAAVWSALLSIYEQSYSLDPNEWVSEAQKAIDLYGLAPEFYKSKYKAQYRLGDFNSMITTCDMGIDILLPDNPDMAIFYLDKIFALGAMNKKEMATATAQQLLQRMTPMNRAIIIENLFWNSVYFDMTVPGFEKYLEEKELNFPHAHYFENALQIKKGKTLSEKDFDSTNFYDALMGVKYFQSKDAAIACKFSKRLNDNLKWNLWIQEMHSKCP